MYKAEKNDELIELYPHVIIDVTCLEKIVDLLLRKRNLQLIKAMPQLFLVYYIV